jgi:L-ascorbate metabolism protein UlaG (beta-lactamase superfamily)
VVALVELGDWLGKQGVDESKVQAPNKGGTVDVDGVKFTLTNAFHSSSSDDGDYLGEAAGIVVTLEDGKRVYFAGDTCVFGDMQLIGRIYSPDVAVLPIGGHFTMDPREAAVACELLGVDRVVPCHYGTFPLLSGSPDELRQNAPGVDVHALDPGESLTL